MWNFSKILWFLFSTKGAISALNHSITKLEVRMHFARAMWHTHESQLNWWVDLLGETFSSNWPKQQTQLLEQVLTFALKKQTNKGKKKPSVPKYPDTEKGYQLNLQLFTNLGWLSLRFIRSSMRSFQGMRTIPRKDTRCVTSAVVTSRVSKKKKCINFSWNVMEPHSLSASIQVGNPKPTDPSDGPFVSLSTWQQSLPSI